MHVIPYFAVDMPAVLVLVQASRRVPAMGGGGGNFVSPRHTTGVGKCHDFLRPPPLYVARWNRQEFMSSKVR